MITNHKQNRYLQNLGLILQSTQYKLFAISYALLNRKTTKAHCGIAVKCSADICKIITDLTNTNIQYVCVYVCLFAYNRGKRGAIISKFSG